MTTSKRVVIGVSGASGTGKTTLAKQLAKQFGGTYAEWNGMSAARDTANEMFGVPLPYLCKTDEDRDILYRGIMRRIVDKIEGHREGVLILDRTPLDQLAYGTMHHTPEIFKAGAIYSALESVNTLFNAVLITPIKRFFNLSDDPARKSEFEYHRVYERILRDVYVGRYQETFDTWAGPESFPRGSICVLRGQGMETAASIVEAIINGH